MMPNDQELVQHAAAEIAQMRHGTLDLSLTPESALKLAGLIQLALRHPSMDWSSSETGQRFLAGVRAYFSDCPTVLEILRRGDDPAEDR